MLTTVAFGAAEVVVPLRSASASLLAGIHRYASVSVDGLAFAAGSATLLAGSGFVVAPGRSGVLTSCSWWSQQGPHCAPAGDIAVRAHLHGEELQELDDAALVTAVRTELRGAIGPRGEPVVTRVYRRARLPSTPSPIARA